MLRSMTQELVRSSYLAHHYLQANLTIHCLVIMRYQDWDVLLFPRGSRAPLQEFRTGCFVIPDPGRSHFSPGSFIHKKAS